MKTTARLFSLLALVCLLVSASASAQEKPKKGNDQVILNTSAVEVVEVKAGAEKCPSQKDSTTLRLKVTSDNPVDVRLYIKVRYNTWQDKDYPNQKRGDKITDFMCLPKAQYKVYSRTAGSNTPWPKP